MEISEEEIWKGRRVKKIQKNYTNKKRKKLTNKKIRNEGTEKWEKGGRKFCLSPGS